MQVLVRSLTGPVLAIDLSHDSSAFSLKRAIQDRTGIPSHLQRLFCRGRLLLEGDVLAALESVDLCLALCGGSYNGVVRRPIESSSSFGRTASASISLQLLGAEVVCDALSLLPPERRQPLQKDLRVSDDVLHKYLESKNKKPPEMTAAVVATDGDAKDAPMSNGEIPVGQPDELNEGVFGSEWSASMESELQKSLQAAEKAQADDRAREGDLGRLMGVKRPEPTVADDPMKRAKLSTTTPLAYSFPDPSSRAKMMSNPKAAMQLRNALLPGQKAGRVLVLQGPCGSGKSLAVRLVARELQLNVVAVDLWPADILLCMNQLLVRLCTFSPRTVVLVEGGSHDSDLFQRLVRWLSSGKGRRALQIPVLFVSSAKAPKSLAHEIIYFDAVRAPHLSAIAREWGWRVEASHGDVRQLQLQLLCPELSRADRSLLPWQVAQNALDGRMQPSSDFSLSDADSLLRALHRDYDKRLVCIEDATALADHWSLVLDGAQTPPDHWSVWVALQTVALARKSLPSAWVDERDVVGSVPWDASSSPALPWNEAEDGGGDSLPHLAVADRQHRDDVRFFRDILLPKKQDATSHTRDETKCDHHVGSVQTQTRKKKNRRKKKKLNGGRKQ